MIRTILACALLWGVMPRPASAQGNTAGDSSGIRAAALDYIEGWYAGDGPRMERALHPELAKRNVTTDAAGRSRLTQMSALSLINGTRTGGGTEIPRSDRRTDVRILDIYGNAATARIDAGGWVDYMHLTKWRGEWKIINVLWENKPEPSR